MTAVGLVTLANADHGTMSPLAAYTNEMERPALAVWTRC
jgi:hypothetical protein